MKRPLVYDCPIEFLDKAVENPELFAVEYLSHPSGSMNPYFRNLKKITQAIGKRPNPIDEDTYLLESLFKAPADDYQPRFMHVDLSISGDKTAFSMCKCVGFRESRQKNGLEWASVTLPIIEFELLARVGPRKDLGETEMDYNVLIDLFLKIEDLGFNLRGGLITFDRFQSHGPLNNLRDEGFNVDTLSIDHTLHRSIVDYDAKHNIRREPTRRMPSAAYASGRDAFYQDRVILPDIPLHPDIPGMTWLEYEANCAQWDAEKQKVVKMSGTSDDLLQTVVGAIFNLENNKEILLDAPTSYDPVSQKQEDAFYRERGRGLGDRNGRKMSPQDDIDQKHQMHNEDLDYIEDNFGAYAGRGR